MRETGKISRGFDLEQQASRHWHKRGIPLLVSPKLLRSRRCGQIDVGVIAAGKEGKKICLVECKSSGLVSKVQYGRLRRSACFLSSLLNFPVFIEIFAKCKKV